MCAFCRSGCCKRAEFRASRKSRLLRHVNVVFWWKADIAGYGTIAILTR